MRTVIALLFVGLIVLAAAAPASAQNYMLNFVPAQNAPPGAQAAMSVTPGTQPTVTFSASGLYPNTVYTIWTVFNLLAWPLPTSGIDVPSTSALTPR